MMDIYANSQLLNQVRAVAGAVLLALIAGCAAPTGTGSDGSVTIDDFGPPPADSDVADSIVKAWFSSRLKDPYSAVIKRVAGPAQFTKKASLLGSSSYGWGLCYTINAKNSYGAYTGVRPAFFVVRDGRVVDTFGGMDGGTVESALARSACQSIGGSV